MRDFVPAIAESEIMPINGAGVKQEVIQDEDGNTQTVYRVDLRELELRVKEAQLKEKEAYIERLEAERALEEARRQQN